MNPQPSKPNTSHDPADALTPMEAALLQRIAGFYQDAELTAQIDQCRVAMREYSGCGFFTTLTVPAGSSLISQKKPFYGGDDIEAPELSHGAGSILFVRGGRLDFLEVFAYVEGDPAQVGSFVVKPSE